MILCLVLHLGLSWSNPQACEYPHVKLETLRVIRVLEVQIYEWDGLESSKSIKNRLDELFIQLGESQHKCSSDEDGLDELFIQLGESKHECSSDEDELDELFIQLGDRRVSGAATAVVGDQFPHRPAAISRARISPRLECGIGPYLPDSEGNSLSFVLTVFSFGFRHGSLYVMVDQTMLQIVLMKSLSFKYEKNDFKTVDKRQRKYDFRIIQAKQLFKNENEKEEKNLSALEDVGRGRRSEGGVRMRRHFQLWWWRGRVFPRGDPTLSSDSHNVSFTTTQFSNPDLKSYKLNNRRTLTVSALGADTFEGTTLAVIGGGSVAAIAAVISLAEP
uniref:Uncharacterized protein n=1 Tax=Lactuca sativa TaxID=4236 RepID=A0A9R1XVJ9_LACSA|nr:hypothetical protein LSAT_V11C100035840 [Lactuca sativa]